MKTPRWFLLALVATAVLTVPGAPAVAADAAASDSVSTDDLDVNRLKADLSLLEEKIRVTKNEISKIRDANYLPDLYFALADMYSQKSRLMYLQKIAAHPGTRPDDLDFTAEKRPKTEAIEIYQKIYSFFPKEKRRDRALFMQGLEERDLGQFDQMVRTFTTLSQDFPTSENFNEANIMLGDYLLERKKDLELAIAAFQKVVNRPLSPFTPLAHYRIGWCYVNLQKNDEAVKSYEAALSSQALTHRNELPASYRKTDIRREAVYALAVPYVELYADPEKNKGQMAAPVDYFRKLSPDHFTYRKVLSRVGRRLILKEKYKESADVFYKYLQLSTDFDSRFEALQRIADAHKRKQAQIDYLPFVREIAITTDLLQAALDQPVTFDADAIIAGEKEKKTKAALQRPVNQFKFLELLMRDFATMLHVRARTTGSAADFDEAATAYEIYLNRFPKAPKALDIQYNQAEALYKGDRLVRAGIQYETLAHDKRLAKKMATFDESALEAYTHALAKAETLTPYDRIRARRGLRDIGTEWIKLNPQASGVPTVAFNIANSWYEERDLKQAITTFKDFIKKYPRDEHVRDAIFLTINSYSQLDDYKGLQATGEQLIKTAGLSAADQNSIKDAVRRAQTKQLQSVGGDFGTKQYAENLLSVASKYKGSALGVQALYEAFNSLKTKKDPELFDVGEAMLDQHADSQYAKEVASTMATLALDTASFDRAARYLTLFATKYPQEKESRDFTKTSAVLFERQGDFRKARVAYTKLGDRAAIARMDLALNDWAALEKSSLSSGSPEANYWHALALWRQHRYQDATGPLRAIASSGNRDQAGHAKFLLTQLSLERFRSIQMKSAEDQQSLGEKVKIFGVLSNELQQVIATGAGRWPIAALYVLGQAQHDLGRFIANSPLPAGLSADDKKMYIGELNKQAQIYIGEAGKVFAKCLEAAQTNDVFTRYVDGCRAKGQKQIKEEDDLAKPQASTSGSEPPKARAIRKSLFEKAHDTDLLFSLGETYVGADQPLTAAGIFARILEIEADNPRAIASIGVTSLYTNEFDSAFASFQHALEKDPQDATALWNMAGLYKQFGFSEKLKAVQAKLGGVKKPKLLHPYAQKLARE